MIRVINLAGKQSLEQTISHVEKGTVALDYVLTQQPNHHANAGRIINPSGGRGLAMEEPNETPCFERPQIQLSDKPFAGQHFSALGARHKEEGRVAKLPFSAMILSDTALQTLRRFLAIRESDSQKDLAAKLAIALSLVTGRDLTVVSKTKIFWKYVGLSKSIPVGIDATSKTLCLFAPSPNVRSKKAKHDNALFMGHTSEIVLPLPEPIMQLCESLDWDTGFHRYKGKELVKQANSLLKTLPASQRINSQTLRYQLGHVLYQLGNSDIGLEKVATDCNEANANNIIHYSGYPIEEVTGTLSSILDRLLGTTTTYSPFADGTAVGCYTTFREEAVVELISSLRQRLEQADPKVEPIRFLNLLTAYTACWLSLATAGRASTAPTPTLVVSGCAIMNDKHRVDGSGLRSIALTETFQTHLHSYIEYVRRHAASHPSFQPLSTAPEAGLAQLFLVIDGKPKPYTPTLLNTFLATEDLIRLRGNWGRHFFEQAGKRAGLDTRLIDAAMGHAVAGRHPNSNMSNFDNPGFQKTIVSFQTELEATLGFTLISQLEPLKNIKPNWHPIWIHRKQGFKEKVKKAPKKFDIPVLIKKDGVDFIAKLKAENDIERQATVLNQLCIHICRHMAKDDPSQLGECFTQLCHFLRTKYGIPAYRVKKHLAFAKEWVTELNDLINLGYFEQHLLPGFKADLEHLPKVDSSIASPEEDLGRLIMIAIWRLGLTSWPLIHAFLKRYIAAPIFHTGKLHYVTFKARAQRNQQLCDRTVLIDDYSAVYLGCRRQPHLAALKPLFKGKSSQVRSACQRALKEYVKGFLPEMPPHLLTSMTASAKQCIWLNASPIIAAYSSQEFETYDIGDNVIRRMHGLAPRESLFGNITTSLTESSLSSKQFQPLKVLKEEKNSFYLKIVNAQSPYVSERHRVTQTLKATNRPENVFLYFSRWFFLHESNQGIKRYSAKHKATLRRQLSIAAYCIAASLPDGEQAFTINGDWLDAIAENFIDNDFNIDIGPTLKLFKTFFKSNEFNQVAKRENLSLGELTTHFSKGPLNNVLAPHELSEIQAELDSPLGPISNWSVREAARDLVELVCVYGIRRNEALGLRGVDFQEPIIRVQAYDEHRLKTAAADRCLPVGFISKNSRILSENRHLHDQLINAAKLGFVNGHNFYDPVNKLIQKITRDESLHLHSIRHTVASFMHLAANSAVAPLELIQRYFPMLTNLDDYQRRFDILVAGEGQTGHGEQAISALLGHAHPTTTQRHYVHTHCLSLFAALQANDSVNPLRSFYHHLQSTRSNDDFIREHAHKR